MKNLLQNVLLSSRNSKLNLVIGVLFCAAFVLACGGGSSTPKKPIPAAYLGSWTAQDGTTINIRADNTGDYDAGGSNVEGAAVEVDETTREIRFTMIGVDVGKYKIDQPPSGDQMKLNGQIYRRTGGFAPPAGETTATANRNPTIDDAVGGGGDDSANGAAVVPEEVELQALAKTTLLDFNSAVQAEDFTSFHSSASSYFQAQFPIAKLEQTFAPFVEKRIDISDISGMQAQLTHSLEQQKGINVLNLRGTYPTAPKTSFELKYVQEETEWKLLSIDVKVQ